ncbi:MAG: hypothetical protein NC926_03930 [Candidatus Omnitrophica bacterium]|nr:hypothetical protein [Candidatus Omnitrophota bacterium]
MNKVRYHIPEKIYFPFVLGNGTDSVMVDYSGSMHCDSGHLHIEQHEGAICCWEKTTHRTRARFMVPLVQFPYRIATFDGELYEVGNFNQIFDPYTATLITEIETTIIRMQIKTFLTDEGLYVERYKILWLDGKRKPVIIFISRKPRYTLCNLVIKFPDTYKIIFSKFKEDFIEGEYSFDEVKGKICMAVKAPGKKKRVEVFSDEGHIKIEGLEKNDFIERYISVKDNTETEEYERICRENIDKALSKNFEEIYKKHSNNWMRFHSQIKVKLPDREIEDIYRKSLYLIRASQHPNGFITEGLSSEFKGGGYMCQWDMLFACRALITSNQRECALKLLDFYHYSANYARIYASQLGRSGVYFPWMTNYKGESLYFENAKELRNIEKFNNGCIAMQLFDVYRFWGDKESLKKNLPLIKEIVDFLIEEMVIEKEGALIIKPNEGADENIDRINDTAHLLTLIEALKGYIEGCKVLNIELNENYVRILENLKKGLRRNYKDGILLQYEGDMLRPVSSAEFTFQIFSLPEGITIKSIKKALKDNQSEWGLTNSGTYRNLIWPWTENRAAIAFSIVDPNITYQRIKHVINFTSKHGIFPEKIRPDGYWILFGYLTAHSSFIYAVNSLLVSDNGKRLFIGVGFPEEWKNIAFENIYTTSGYGVSFSLKNGRIKKLVIENCREDEREITIYLLNKHFGKEHIIFTQRLKPGKNKIF